MLVAVENTKPSIKDARLAVPDIGRINILQRFGRTERPAKPELTVFLPNELLEPPVGFVKGFDFAFSVFTRSLFSSPKFLAADIGPDFGIDASSFGIE
jgi:hypothetical protein